MMKRMKKDKGDIKTDQDGGIAQKKNKYEVENVIRMSVMTLKWAKLNWTKPIEQDKQEVVCESWSFLSV